MLGDSFTYKFIAWQAGTFLYHSTMERQTAQRLMGAFIVLPTDENYPNFKLPYGDYVLVLQQ